MSTLCTRLQLICADSGYDGAPLTGWLRSVAGITLQNDSSGQMAPTWDNPTVRGDLSMTTDQAGHQVGPLRAYDPFGQPLDADGTVDTQNVPDNSPGAMDYGWLGQDQRPFEHAGALNLVQMGARPYSPLLGRFLSVDPQPGGSANDYDYADGNPINATDLFGERPDPVDGDGLDRAQQNRKEHTKGKRKSTSDKHTKAAGHGGKKTKGYRQYNPKKRGKGKGGQSSKMSQHNGWGWYHGFYGYRWGRVIILLW